MGKTPSLEMMELKKGPWTSEEDRKLVAYVEKYGHGSWSTLPLKAGLQRCGKSCRLRWTNYLRPDIKRGKFSLQEEQSIIQLHALLGNRWSTIASHLPRRTDNEIKNYWNTNLKKRLTKMGIDPITHKSRIAVTTNLNHMTQWENARLEAEARLVREPRLAFKSCQGIQNDLFSLINQPQPQPQPQPVHLDMLHQACQSIILSKRSYLKGAQTPYSTLKFFEKALSSLSNIQNRSRPVNDPFENTIPSSKMDMAAKDCTDDSEILKEPFNIFDVSVEENKLENKDILYQDDYMVEALTRPLVGYPSNDFEDNNDYWIHILDKLGNNSSLSSIL